MRTLPRMVFGAAVALAILAASSARAQNAPAPTNGPLVLERIHDGWVIAPDFKVTDFDNRTGELAGAYGGRLIDGTLFIGGAGYWLANSERDFKLGYGGVIVGWQSPEYGRIRFGGRGLVGAGQATLGFDAGILRGGPVPAVVNAGRGDIRFGVTPQPGRGAAPAPLPTRGNVPVQTLRARVLGRDNFLVFEPQANITARIAGNVSVSCGASYRATAQTGVLRDRLNGPGASLAIQFGW